MDKSLNRFLGLRFRRVPEFAISVTAKVLSAVTREVYVYFSVSGSTLNHSVHVIGVRSNAKNASDNYGCSKPPVQTQAIDPYIASGGFAFEAEEFATQWGRREAQAHMPVLAP